MQQKRHKKEEIDQENRKRKYEKHEKGNW